MKRSSLPMIVVLLLAAAAPVSAEVHFTIDAARDVKPISRFIYGVNQRVEGRFADLPFTRVGGNRWTAYNWVNNASNAGSDYQFQNDNMLGGGETPGGALIPLLKSAADHKAGILITVPIIGYVAADKKGGGDVHKSGKDYLRTRFRQELAKKPGPFTLTPDPQTPQVYQDEFVNWIKVQFPYGFKDPDRPIFFSLDNEPDLWRSTHKEVHPEPLTYAEIVQKSIDYAAAIKAVIPSATVYGPVNYGWQGYIDLQKAPDSKLGDFQNYYLQQMAQAEKSHGKRLLDVFDVHWYPEATGGGKRVSGDSSAPAVAAARVQAPRSLWDSTYAEKSWITQWSTKGPIRLVPRLREKIDQYYPGTKLSLSEYNYGGGADISGGIAEADVLGIFGREGVFSANEWPLSGHEQFIAGGLAMFRNFDGAKGCFGDRSVFAATDDLASSSIYASTDSTDSSRMVLVAINKTDAPLEASIEISHGRPFRVAKVSQLTAEAPEPHAAEGLAVKDPKHFAYTMPGFSVSTISLGMK